MMGYSQISSQSKQKVQSDAVEASGRDKQAAAAPLTNMLDGQATQAPPIGKAELVQEVTQATQAPPTAKAEPAQALPTGKAEPVQEETLANGQTMSGKTQASGKAEPEGMRLNGEMPPTPVVTVTMYADDDEAAGKSRENGETAQAVVRSESDESSVTVESVKTSVVVTAATSAAERDNGSSSPDVTTGSGQPTTNGVTASSPVHRESPEFPAERKQSTSSSGSSETSSPSKLPPPTAPKSGKVSPPNQGKMPTSRTDNLGGDIDITSLPGFQNIPENCPGWKKAMIEKKNMQLLEDTRKDLIAKKVEEEKWRDVPEWKRSLILEKERKKKEENEPVEAQRKRIQEEENRLHNMPGWKKNLVLKKKD